MIAIQRVWVLFFAAFLGLILAAGFFPGESAGGALIPIVVTIEFVIYFVLTLMTNPRMSLGAIATTSVTMVVIRAFACFVGVVIASSVSTEKHDWATSWVGNPISVAAQVALLMLVAPHLLAEVAPGLVGPELREQLGLEVTPDRKPTGDITALESSPTGGFIQVFSYEELAATIRKSTGLEGFVIYGNDGLVVWRDLPMRLDVDQLVARVVNLSGQIGTAVESNGLTRVRKIMIESRDHLIFNTALNENFGVIMVFSSRVSAAECLARIGVIAKTSREFLQWKYPVLPVSPASTQSQIAVEMLR